MDDQQLDEFARFVGAGHRGRPWRRHVLLLAGLISAGWFGSACWSSTPPSSPPSPPVTLVVGIPQTSQTGPTGSLRTFARRMSFEGLVDIDREGRPRPVLAERWAESADRRSWEIQLRHGVVFHDGTPMTAEDVKAAILDATKDATGSALRSSLTDIAGVDIIAPLKLRVSVRRPAPFLLRDLDGGISRNDADGNPIGTGPFYTVSQKPDQIVMVAHRGYPEGAPAVDRVVLRPYDTLRTAWASMMRGEIDFLWEVGQDALDFVRRESSVQVLPYLSPYVYAIVFNARHPQLGDPAIRRALNMAIDREAILQQVLKGRGTVSHLPIWPQEWAHDSTMPTYAYDVEGATAQLKERVRGRRSTAGTAPTSLVQFTCLVPDNFAIYERIALIVQKQLYEAGVDMRLEGVPVKEFNARRDNGTFDALIIPPLAGPRVIRLYPFWHSAPHSTPYNPWGYGDPDVDAALEAMQDARDEAAFREATRRFGLAMYQNPPGIFLAWPEVAQAVSKRFQVNGENNRDAFYSIARWKPTALDGDAR